jgi:plasmid stabilization system protein ParE
MIGRVIFTSEADDDIAEAYNWYEGREPGLGEEFLRCLEARILTIQRQPEIYRVAVDEFRRAFMRRFPYEIFYEPADDAIVIYSIFHCSQNPQKWRRRLEH